MLFLLGDAVAIIYDKIFVSSSSGWPLECAEWEKQVLFCITFLNDMNEYFMKKTFSTINMMQRISPVIFFLVKWHHVHNKYDTESCTLTQNINTNSEVQRTYIASCQSINNSYYIFIQFIWDTGISISLHVYFIEIVSQRNWPAPLVAEWGWNVSKRNLLLWLLPWLLFSVDIFQCDSLLFFLRL